VRRDRVRAGPRDRVGSFGVGEKARDTANYRAATDHRELDKLDTSKETPHHMLSVNSADWYRSHDESPDLWRRTGASADGSRHGGDYEVDAGQQRENNCCGS
jgi:hypothetical protein